MSTRPTDFSSAPSTSSSNLEESKNETSYTSEEIAFLESMVRVMKWAEQQSKDILENLNSSGSTTDPDEQARQILSQYFAPDANGNEFPIADYLAVTTTFPFK